LGGSWFETRPGKFVSHPPSPSQPIARHDTTYCHPSYHRKYKIRGSWFRLRGLGWGRARPYLKNNQRKKVGGMAQAVEHRAPTCLASVSPSSNPSTTKKLKKERKQ
jgi:hypothetical protein